MNVSIVGREPREPRMPLRRPGWYGDTSYCTGDALWDVRRGLKDQVIDRAWGRTALVIRTSVLKEVQ